MKKYVALEARTGSCELTLFCLLFSRHTISLTLACVFVDVAQVPWGFDDEEALTLQQMQHVLVWNGSIDSLSAAAPRKKTKTADARRPPWRC